MDLGANRQLARTISRVALSNRCAGGNYTCWANTAAVDLILAPFDGSEFLSYRMEWNWIGWINQNCVRVEEVWISMIYLGIERSRLLAITTSETKAGLVKLYKFGNHLIHIVGINFDFNFSFNFCCCCRRRRRRNLLRNTSVLQTADLLCVWRGERISLPVPLSRFSNLIRQ